MMETTTENQLIVIVENSGLEKTKGQILLDRFSSYFEAAAEIEIELNKLGEEDYIKAGEIRKALKNNRIESEKIRKELKESSLREGQTIDAIGRIIKNLIEPLEEKAEQIERAKEIRAAQEKEERKIIRMTKLSLFNVASDASIIAEMTDEMFDSYLAGVQKDHNDRLERERIAEEERVAKEKAEAEERERQRLENIRLKAEAEAREKEIAEERAKAEAERLAAERKAAAEKAKIEAKLKAEREAREKLEREAKLKAEAEAKEKKEADEAARIASLAPVKEKLNTWVSLMNIEAPIGLESDKIVLDIIDKFNAFKKWGLSEITKIK